MLRPPVVVRSLRLASDKCRLHVESAGRPDRLLYRQGDGLSPRCRRRWWPYEVLHRDFPGSRSLLDFNYPALTQEELEQRLGASIGDQEVTCCTGPAGTVIFRDSAALDHAENPPTPATGAQFSTVAAAPLALRGDGSHVMPLDNCIEAMRQTGEAMNAKFKETSLGGLAVNLPEC